MIEGSEFGISRDCVYDLLKEKGIYTRKYFYPLTNSFACYKDQYDVKETPVALDVSKKVLTLPLYADLALEDVYRICDNIKALGGK